MIFSFITVSFHLCFAFVLIIFSISRAFFPPHFFSLFLPKLVVLLFGNLFISFLFYNCLLGRIIVARASVDRHAKYASGMHGYWLVLVFCRLTGISSIGT